MPTQPDDDELLLIRQSGVVLRAGLMSLLAITGSYRVNGDGPDRDCAGYRTAPRPQRSPGSPPNHPGSVGRGGLWAGLACASFACLIGGGP